jgi:glycosyltransferase involved in cell wall biosynthesis
MAAEPISGSKRSPGAVRRRILYVYNDASTWVLKDRDALAEVFDVREVCFRRRPEDVAAILRGVAWADAVYGWFASVHSLVAATAARALRKPAVITIGGYDTASLPEIEYGNLRPGLMRPATLAALRLADLLLPVSHYAAAEVQRNGGVDPKRLRVIHHGFSAIPAPAGPKERLVVTVGGVNESNLTRKGLRAFVDLAARVPDARFMVVGGAEPHALAELMGRARGRVEFAGFLTDAALDAVYARASVYVQLSAHEAFGSSVAEAMLSGCVPVVAERGALPEVVGSTGIVVPYGDVDAAAVAVRQALAEPERGPAARARVLEEFPLARRKAALTKAFAELLGER